MTAIVNECPAGVHQQAMIVATAQTDACGRITPGAIARAIGDATVEHMASAGLTADRLRDHGLLWVLARTAIEVALLPRQGETVLLRTWAGKERHWMYPRRTVIFSVEGEPLVTASSQWLIVDTSTRKLAPPSELMQAMPVVSLADEPKAPAMSMAFPSELTMQTQRVVQPSEIDMNGHLNNSYYLDWARGLLDAAYLQTHALHTLWVEYAKELLVGQCANLRYQQENDTVFVKGFADGENSFSIKLNYAEVVN